MLVEVLSDGSQSRKDSNRNWNDELAEILPPVPLQPLHPAYDFGHFGGIGAWQGALAGCVSLLANVIGSVLWPAISGTQQHPLRLIQVYLTFPLGESALELNSGILLAIGCLMYLATGMLYGMLFVILLSYFLPHASVWGRLLVCSVLAIAIWGINFYGILAWLQPLLFGGRWVIELLPWWVAALTHLVFGWTIALIYPLANNPESDSVEITNQ
jgi:hypothetical protein